MKELDEKTLRFFTRIAHWLQLTLGVTCYKLSSYINGIAALVALLVLVPRIELNLEPVIASCLYMIKVLSSLNFLLDIKAMRQMSQCDKAFMRDSSTLPVKKRAHSSRVALLLATLCLLVVTSQDLLRTLSATRLIMTLLYGQIVISQVASYMADVVPLPPGQSKIGKWVTGIRESLRPRVPVRVGA